jgi:hypothetical protein
MNRREHADLIRAWALRVSEHAEALREDAMQGGGIPDDVLPDLATVPRERVLDVFGATFGREIAPPYVSAVLALAEDLLALAEDARTFAAQIESGLVKGYPWDEP